MIVCLIVCLIIPDYQYQTILACEPHNRMRPLGRCNRNWLQDWKCIQQSWYKQDCFKNRSVALKYVNKFSDGLNCNGNMFKDTAQIDHTQIYRILCQLNPAKCHPCLHSAETWSRHWSVITTGETFFFSRLELLKAEQNLNPILIKVHFSFVALQLHVTTSSGIGFQYAIISQCSGTKASCAGPEHWKEECSPAIN